jgi:hypothetical protein
MNPISIGKPPFITEDLVDYLDEFLDLYKDRPIQDNEGGMLSPHMFAAWLITKKIQPESIIESGVYRGQGTWLLERAAPMATLTCIEPDYNRIEYLSKKAKYITSDFSKTDWGAEDLDPKHTLCFFDDHQDAPNRLPIIRKFNFKHLVLEDNYPRGQGDCKSLKSALESDDLSHENLNVYWEFPPVIKTPTTRWGDKWTNDNYPTKNPILLSCRKNHKVFANDAQSYTWICYAEASYDGFTS